MGVGYAMNIYAVFADGHAASTSSGFRKSSSTASPTLVPTP
jgi:hypothetical protein